MANLINKISKRPKGRPPIDKWIKDYIYGEARSIRNKNTVSEALALKVISDITNEGGVPPTKETAIKWIQQARRFQSELDELWSIAASVQRKDFPPEFNELLFDIWRYSLAIDRPISIRQARWIVGLKPIVEAHYKKSYGIINSIFPEQVNSYEYSFKVNLYLTLISQSWLYSVREIADELMSRKKDSIKPFSFNTCDLDAASFISPPELNVASKLGKLPQFRWTPEQLKKLEEFGSPLSSPPMSIKSVEQAVWHNVRSSPPQNLDILEMGFSDEVLPEEEDLVAAYLLNYLSKGPLWNGLQIDIDDEEVPMNQQGFHVDSGRWSGEDEYLEQKKIRLQLLELVKQHSSAAIPDNRILLPPKLLKKVGYEVKDEDARIYFEWHEKELKMQHAGWNLLSQDIRKRFIEDAQIDDDLEELIKANNQVKVEQKQREQEFLKLVQDKGGVPANKEGHAKISVFWTSVRDEWVKRYPRYKKNVFGYLQWKECQSEYELIMKKEKEVKQ